jgi:hypothetical protein
LNRLTLAPLYRNARESEAAFLPGWLAGAGIALAPRPCLRYIDFINLIINRF